MRLSRIFTYVLAITAAAQNVFSDGRKLEKTLHKKPKTTYIKILNIMLIEPKKIEVVLHSCRSQLKKICQSILKTCKSIPVWLAEQIGDNIGKISCFNAEAYKVKEEYIEQIANEFTRITQAEIEVEVEIYTDKKSLHCETKSTPKKQTEENRKTRHDEKNKPCGAFYFSDKNGYLSEVNTCKKKICEKLFELFHLPSFIIFFFRGNSFCH